MGRPLQIMGLCLTAFGCTPELGACDLGAARQVVFVAPFEGDVSGLGGQALFEGQAQMVQSCGNGGFCHAEVSSADARFGAFSGWSLDVRPACDARPPSQGCAPQDRERLLRGQSDGFHERQAVLNQVFSGAMPPGDVGRVVVAEAPSFIRADGSQLPSLGTDEGDEIFRNWLSCGLPVVERVEDVPAGAAPGDYCGDVQVGDCIYAGARNVEPPEPNWDSIYTQVIEPACANCHGPGETDYREESQLDLSDVDIAYEQIVGVTATGAFCTGEGRSHIVAGDPDASLFLEKLIQDNTCGDRMPLGGPYFPASITDAIQLWIENGAPRGETL